MKEIFLFLFVCWGLNVQAQTKESTYVKKEFLIIYSGNDYASCHKKAVEASTKLKVKLNLRQLNANKAIGLSLSEMNCESEHGFFPCYVARGKNDDGAYVSIEYSDAYIDFEKGNYLVILSSYPAGHAGNRLLFERAQKIYKEAVLKSSKVYTGCIH
jgi:hypothetical protein